MPYLSTLQQQAERAATPIKEQVQRLLLATLHSLLDWAKEGLHVRAEQDSAGGLERIVRNLERTRRITQHLFLPDSTLPPLANSPQADLDAYREKLDTRRRQRIVLTGIPTGFVDLDTVTGGCSARTWSSLLDLPRLAKPVSP